MKESPIKNNKSMVNLFGIEIFLKENVGNLLINNNEIIIVR